ncbi:orotidine-5'-phosphate decarboxylase [Acidihalobacter prosperus]
MGSVASVTTGSRVIVALDYPDEASALRLVELLDPELCRLKVGFELFVSAGPALVENLAIRGFDVFLDLKFHDIPNTVASACRAAANLGVWMLNVHASGGIAMMSAAREALASLSSPPLLIAVTVLTSLDNSDLKAVGVDRTGEEQVIELARLAESCGLDGVVCSGTEAKPLRNHMGDDFILVTPGIRLQENTNDDQKRVLTPEDAIRAGSDFLVIGRTITRTSNPLSQLRLIDAQIRSTGA